MDHKYDVQAFLADKNIAKIEYRALKATGEGVHGQKMKFALSERTRWDNNWEIMFFTESKNANSKYTNLF